MPTFDSRRLLEDLIARATPRIRRRFGEIILQLQREASLAELARLIESGRIDQALSLLDSAANRLAATVQSVWIGAGSEVAEAMSEALGIQVAFDVTNVNAVAAMQQNRLTLVREFTSQQRAATREALLDGIRRGLNPREQARAFRDSIGLTARQQQAVSNYRRLLEENSAEALTRRLRDARFDRSLQNAIANETPLSRAQIDRMVERYRERYLKYRSEVIGRTEALRSVHEGAEEAFRQAIADGHVKPNEVRRIWNTAKDERVRSTHAAMHRQEQPVGVPFLSGAGVPLRFPADPSAPPEESILCRCVVATRVEL